MKRWLFPPLLFLKRKKIYFSLPAIFVLTIATTIFLSSRNTGISQGPTDQNNITGSSPVVRSIASAEDLANTDSLGILLLGYGGPGHSGGFLTDTIQVIHIDFANQSVSLISIPRDLWVTIADGTAGKINEAFSHGMSAKNFGSQPGVDTAKQMAAQVTGIPIDYFVGIDFVGLQRAIGEKLKGVEVVVSETLDDPWYPIRGEELNTCGMSPEEVADVSAKLSGFELEKQFPCRYERVYFPAGTHTMEGGDALAFVRSRHGSSAGDFSRSKRQHELLQAIVKKMLTLDAIADTTAFFASFDKIITTDITANVVGEFSPQLLSAAKLPRKTIVLGTENVLTTSRSITGQFILVPKTGASDWQTTQNFVTKEQ